MARLVKRDRKEPYEIQVGGESQWICACGLSAKLPYCDGTHKITRDETPGKLYWYDEDRKRHEAEDAFPGMRADVGP